MEYKNLHSFNLSTTVIYPYSLSWSEDNNIAAVTQKGIYIMSLVPDPRAKGKVVNLVQECIESPTEVNPHHDLGIDAKLVKSKIPRLEMHEVILDRAFGPLRYSDEPVLSVYRRVTWSPPGIGIWPSDQSCVLAALGVDFRLVLYQNRKYTWTPFCDISKLWKERCHTAWDTEKVDELNLFPQLRTRAYKLATLDLGWSRLIDGKAYLLTLQRNGQVNIWKVLPLNTSTSDIVEFYDSFDCQMDKPSTLHISHDLLFIGSVQGSIRCFRVKYGSEAVTVENLGFVQQNLDELAVEKLLFTQIRQENLLLAVKGSCLMAYTFHIGTELENVQQTGAFVEGLRTTSVTEADEVGKFVLVTEDYRLYQISIRLLGNELSMTLVPSRIHSNENMGCKGLVQSPNSHLICALEGLKVPYDHLSIRDPTSISFYSSANLACGLQTLAETKRKDLAQHTPSLELFRALLANNPEKNWELSLHNLKEHSTYYLKLIRWLFLLKISHNPDLTEMLQSVKNVEKEIFLRHVSNVWERLRMLDMEESLFNKLIVLIKFSQENQIEIPLKNNRNLSTLSTETCPICAAETELTNISSDACPNGHKFPRCAETLRICAFRPRRCLHCKVFYHQDKGMGLTQACTFCDGPIIA